MSRTIYFVFTSISICLWGTTALSAEVANPSFSAIQKLPVCVNGDLDKNQKLLDSFEQSADPLVAAFNSSRKVHHPDIEVCDTDPAKEEMSFLDTMSQAFGLSAQKKDLKVRVIHHDPPPRSTFNRECLVAAMKRHPGNAGYICDYPKGKDGKVSSLKQSAQKTYGTATATTGQCVNNKYVDYMKFAVDSVYDCLSPKDNPLDASTLFKKFNAETGFNNTVAWKGGVGAAQLTSDAVDELTDEKLGNCTEILREVASSDKKSCEPFKAIAQGDSTKAPVISSKNYCDWVSPGDGLARTLMYGTAYNRCMRDQYILPKLRKKAPALAKNRAVVNALTTITYGRGGINQAQNLMDRLRLTNKSDPKQVLTSLTKSSPYLRENNAKIKEMYCLKKNLVPGSDPCKKLKLSTAEESGNLCVTQ